MHEFRVFVGSLYVGVVRADCYEQAVDRARVKFHFGPCARVRVSRVDDV
jgi:hypothetical protein